ncbi:MAG: M protein trans-acting positive regulator PRD domain-containing protein [Streptococcus mitis]|nr:M protein trans-acting positive regulator PRD domain-containing protein [Streptococcus mitis]
MRNLLSTKDQRQLRLMETLIQNRNWIRLHALAEKLGCTERILKNDLNELRTAFPNIDIQSSVNGIMIDLDVNTSVEDIYQYFLAHSQSFQLLEYMFFNEGLPIYRTVENLHSSNANLYRLGRNITKTLSSQFQIELSFTPTAILGNETDIRYFFAQYFSERYYFLDWPFPDLPEEDLTEFADFFYKITNYPMRFSIYRMYKLMIAISIYRVKNGHFIDLPNHFFDEYYPLLMNIPNFEELLVHFSEKLGLEITPDIIAQIFISFIQNNLFLNPQEFFNSLEENSEARYSYQLLSQILESLSKQYKITFTNHDELIWHLHNTAFFERQEIFSTPILFEQKALTIKKFEVYFPDFMGSARQELAQYRQNLSTQLLENRPPIKVLIISNFDHAISLTFVDMLSYYCNNRFTFDIWDELQTSPEILNQTDYDIIVSNFYIPGITKKFICRNHLSIMDLVNHLNTLSNEIHISNTL